MSGREIADYITERLSLSARMRGIGTDALKACVREALVFEEEYAQASADDYDEDSAYEAVLAAMCGAFPDIQPAALAEVSNACVLINCGFARFGEPAYDRAL